MFASTPMRAEYREEPCRTALTRVARGMPFGWSLNPYMGCVHRCTFCYVRAFEQRADRPSDDRYGRSIRVKTNVVEVLRAELARPSWQREQVDDRRRHRPVPAGRGPLPADARLHRGARRGADAAGDHHARAARRPRRRRAPGGGAARRRAGQRLDPDARPRGLAAHRAGHGAARAAAARAEARSSTRGIRVGVGMAPILPGLSDRPEQLEAVVRAAREAGATQLWVERAQPAARHARALPRAPRPRLARAARALRAACTRAARTSAASSRSSVQRDRRGAPRAARRCATGGASGSSRRPSRSSSAWRCERVPAVRRADVQSAARWPPKTRTARRRTRSRASSSTTTRSSAKGSGSRSPARPTSA